ncbi:hypothetical protein GEMRC1_006605 [Eukaryota sp. GEM-RC1]
MGNVSQINDGLVFSVNVNSVCKNLTHTELLIPLVEHIILELNHCINSPFDISSLVLPQSLPVQHQNVLLDTFHKLGYPDITVVSTLEALVASYLFKAPAPSQLETVVIVDVGHLLTKAVVFLHQPSGINIIHSEEWWMGADKVDQALYEYCLTKIDEKIRVTMNERSKMKLLLACNKAKTKTRMSVLVEDFYPNGDFEEDVPPSVLDSFLKDLSGKLEAFRENFVKLLEEQAKYVQSQFVTKVVPVGRLAALHSVRERMRSAFKAPLACILDPNTDVALGGLRWKDPSNVKHLRPQNVVLTHTGAEPHEEKTEQTQLIVSGTPIEELGADRLLYSNGISRDRSCVQDAPRDPDSLPINHSSHHPSNNTTSGNGISERMPVLVSKHEQDIHKPVPGGAHEVVFTVEIEPLNHFVRETQLTIKFGLTLNGDLYEQTQTVPEFTKSCKFHFDLCAESGDNQLGEVNVQIFQHCSISHQWNEKFIWKGSVADVVPGIQLPVKNKQNVPIIRVSGTKRTILTNYQRETLLSVQ